MAAAGLAGTQVDAGELRGVLAAAQRLVPGRNASARADRAVLLRAASSQLTVTAYDGHTGYRHAIDATGGPGQALVDARSLGAALGGHSCRVSLDLSGAHVTVAAGSAVARLAALKLLVPRDRMRRALAQVRRMLDSRCPVTLTFSAGRGSRSPTRTTNTPTPAPSWSL